MGDSKPADASPRSGGELAIRIGFFEIAQLHAAGIFDQNIRGADFAVNLATLVEKIQRSQNLL
jgi:hypothetical protein